MIDERKGADREEVAGDVNSDGYSDVIVGAYFYDNGQTDEGAAFVYHGAPAPAPLSVRIPWTLYE